MKKRKTNKKYKFVTIAFFLVVLGTGYLYFSNEIRTGKMFGVAQGSLMSSATASEPFANASVDGSSGNNKISSDISFLSTLVSLKKIRIDSSFFSNNLFSKLKSNAVSIGTAIPGRTNPFAPIDESSVAKSVVNELVITSPATQITDKTAVLNGLLGSATGVTETYFEYGQTESLGDTTSVINQQSMVGSFVKSISDLSSRTVYYFKACAKINGTSVCGDTMSFSTN